MLGRSWSIDLLRRGGRWSVEATAPFEVTVLRRDDCQPILSFTGQPGRIHAIQFEADGTATMAFASGSDGGGLGPTAPVCSLPDTASAPSPAHGSARGPVGLVLALAAALGLLLARRRVGAGTSD